MVGKWGLPLVVIFLAACASSQEYTTDSPQVLVKPTHRAWLKPGTTDEDELQAMRACGDERRSNEELRKSSMQVRSEAYEACMNRKGFRYYKKR